MRSIWLWRKETVSVNRGEMAELENVSKDWDEDSGYMQGLQFAEQN